MEETMKQFQQNLIEIENEAEHLLLARHQVIQPKQFVFLNVIIFTRLFEFVFYLVVEECISHSQYSLTTEVNAFGFF